MKKNYFESILGFFTLVISLAFLFKFVNVNTDNNQTYQLKAKFLKAGGISSGKSMLAAIVLGADAVQIGSRFVVSEESSAHINFKNKILDLKDGDTILTLKELTPVRMIKNNFFSKIEDAYLNDASVLELEKILGKGRAKKGMFLGDLDDGELEIGQVSALLQSIKPAKFFVKYGDLHSIE